MKWKRLHEYDTNFLEFTLLTEFLLEIWKMFEVACY